MNIPIEQFIPSGTTAIGGMAGLVTLWFKFQNKVERLEEDKNEFKTKLEAAFRRIDENRNFCQTIYQDHQKEAIDNREKINHEIANLNAANLVTTEQLKNMQATLAEIKQIVSELRK